MGNKMPESLLHKYPHLKLLLSESREKRTNQSEGNEAVNKTELLSSITNDVSGPKSDEIIAPPRKSILGPGVGPRIDCKPPTKKIDSK